MLHVPAVAICYCYVQPHLSIIGDKYIKKYIGNTNHYVIYMLLLVTYRRKSLYPSIPEKKIMETRPRRG